jgi:hypothetical protein
MRIIRPIPSGFQLAFLLAIVPRTVRVVVLNPRLHVNEPAHIHILGPLATSSLGDFALVTPSFNSAMSHPGWTSLGCYT